MTRRFLGQELGDLEATACLKPFVYGAHREYRDRFKTRQGQQLSAHEISNVTEGSSELGQDLAIHGQLQGGLAQENRLVTAQEAR